LLALYLVGAAAALGCVIYLAFRQLSQDSFVEAQRAKLRLDAFADRVVALSQQQLNELERTLRSVDPSRIPPDTIVLSGDDTSLRIIGGGPLLFQPVAPTSTVVPDDIFLAGELTEFGAAGPERAVELYRTLAAHSSRAVRAGALLRLGRTWRKLGRHVDAVNAYDRLERLSDVVIDGRPADVWARLGRGRVFNESGARADLVREAVALRADLSSGRWPLSAAEWESLFADATEWAGSSARLIPTLEHDKALATTVSRFWHEWRFGVPMSKVVASPAGPFLIDWDRQGPRWHAVVAGPTRVDAMRRQVDVDPDFVVTLLDQNGAPLFGATQPMATRRAASETGLPWTVTVAEAHVDLAARLGRVRRLTFVGVLAVVSLLIVASGCFTFRGIRRELETARHQAEFVSAVSHEFRTPLTSIRQLSSLLQHGRVLNDARRSEYYDVLVRESERLQRLIERLLSLGRAEANKFRFEAMDACELARAVVDEFRARDRERAVELSLPASPCPLRADREMLALAVWNLLDNAAKYSPAERPVRVDVASGEGFIAIGVHDEGGGIPPEDRRRIFDQFVRGRDGTTAGLPGSGLGLALVDRVARAHGGRVRLDSEVGRGSSFTILIPEDRAA
jgi:signal transduction histidine kinase